ncbi:MAG: TrkH family potassium uptake protein [Clostridia bacterium]|nr:TrkH family potassium uptake protein [Clostridia bacterium]
MNFKALGRILGKIMILEGGLMLAPLIVGLIYKEPIMNIVGFIIPIVALVGIGFLLQIPKPKRVSLYQKEGFALVALVWIIMALFGALPFVISGDIKDFSYIDACFEIMSGFTTTGASVIADITEVSHSILFWRSFSHWIGGMGILAFVLIFIPESNDGSSMHLLRAESPGPQVGKIVSKMKMTTGILYLIYLGLTVLEFIFLLFDNPIPGYENDKVFNCMLATFGCAGTGGFGFLPGSMELFSQYSQYVMSIFLILFGVNFALYYLILIGKIKDVFRSEEFKSYFITVFFAVGVIFGSLMTSLEKLGYTIEEAFRHSLFQVASIITTTGYSTTDFNHWPMPAITMLVLLMFSGAMAGSTSGGIKMSRMVIAFKGAYVNIRKLINPRYVSKSKFEGKTLSESTTNGVFAFFTLYLFILIIVTLLLSFDPVNGTEIVFTDSDLIEGGTYTQIHGFFTNFSASLSCLSNIGPGFEAVGPYGSFAHYSWFSKLVLTFTMLFGRLEILPVMILFSPKTWKRT